MPVKREILRYARKTAALRMTAGQKAKPGSSRHKEGWFAMAKKLKREIPFF
jgi:hypothetical protein